MDISDTLTIIAIIVSIIFSIISVLITFRFEINRKNERFEELKGTLNLNTKQIGDYKYIFLENTGNSSLKITDVKWKDEDVVTLGDIYTESTEPDIPVYSKSLGLILGKQKKIKYILYPNNYSLNLEKTYLCTIKYETLNKLQEQELELRFNYDGIDNVWFGTGKKEKELIEIGKNIKHVLKEINETLT